MGSTNVKAHEAKKTHIMIKCFECYAEHGLGAETGADQQGVINK